MFGLDRYPDPAVRLEHVVEMMREISVQQDPEKLTQVYGQRMAEFLRSNGFLSASRRGHTFPEFRITRSSRLPTNLDPWRDRNKLPVLSGGLMAELIYGNFPKILRPLVIAPDDPVREFIDPAAKCLVVVPHYDQGVSLNMVCHFYHSDTAFNDEDLPELVWMSNLFGRAVNNLALSRDLQDAYNTLDRELKVVEQLQRTLLPQGVPPIPTLKLAAHYQTSRNAGGDYYDFFDLGTSDEGGRQWGIFMADVSGHGTPAAVVMAVTHALAHSYPGHPKPPGLLLHYLNQKLCASPTSASGAFVTGVYAIYDDRARTLTWSSAGHPAARLFRAGSPTALALDGAQALPLGISPDERYPQSMLQLRPGDRLAWYTDGITESFDPRGVMFDVPRLDEALLSGGCDPQEMINSVNEKLGLFTTTPRGEDDRTLITAVVQ